MGRACNTHEKEEECIQDFGGNIRRKEGTKTKLRGFSPQANYTDRATAACRRS
jgi:hypothetical protein